MENCQTDHVCVFVFEMKIFINLLLSFADVSKSMFKTFFKHVTFNIKCNAISFYKATELDL